MGTKQYIANKVFEVSLLLSERTSDWVTGGPTYQGFAKAGSKENDEVWMIVKFHFDGSNNMVKKTFAEGSDNFDKSWANRASYEYL